MGAGATPPAEIYASLTRQIVEPDLCKIARMRSGDMRAAFEEGVRMGAGSIPPASPLPELWRRSDTLKRLATGEGGFDVVGVIAVCSDVRAAGRSYWRVCGAWRGRSWVQSIDPGFEPVDLVVPLDSLRRTMAPARPLTITDTRIGGI